MSETYEIKGNAKHIGATETIGAKGFTKRELIVTVPDEKYPQDIKIEFTKDNCSKLDNVGIGDEVTVGFNIRGSEYNGKHYVSLTGWKITTEAF